MNIADLVLRQAYLRRDTEALREFPSGRSRIRIEYMEPMLACARGGYMVQALNWRLSKIELANILQAWHASASGAADPSEVAGDHDPFLVVYTGGSTGVSKGAVHTHRTAACAMANNLAGANRVSGPEATHWSSG